MDSGIQVSVNGLSDVADQLDSAAGVLHGHADTIEGVSIPAAAFGAQESAAAQFAVHQQNVASAVRGSATRVQGHGVHARTALGTYVSTDRTGATRARSVEA